MKNAVLSATAIVAICGCVASAQVGITAIGAPSGGTSIAYGVSGDGQVVVGYNATIVSVGPPVVFQNEAIRWTSGGGRVGLGDLAGGSFESRAFGANADGTVIVGFSNSGRGGGAFRWTGAG